jgi:hypothetical protein
VTALLAMARTPLMFRSDTSRLQMIIFDFHYFITDYRLFSFRLDISCRLFSPPPLYAILPIC